LILGAVTSGSSIFSSLDSKSTQLSKALTRVNQIIASLCNILPAVFKIRDPLCQKSLRIISMTTGSIGLSA
jgi:hypothetical protein